MRRLAGRRQIMVRRIPYRWILAVVLFVAYSIQYLDRVKTSVLNPSIARDIGLSTTDIGTGAFLMLLFYGPAQMLSGWLSDRFGAKRILLGSIVAWSIMTAWMGLIATRQEYLLRMALFGILVGTEYVPSARILVRWFNKEGRARAQSLLSWAWILTPAWASVLATQFADRAGSWRLVFFVTAALGIVPLLLVLFLVFERPEHYGGIKPEELEYAYRDEVRRGVLGHGSYANAQSEILRKDAISFLDFFRNSSYFAIIFVNITLVMTLYAVLNWIPFYLSDTFHFSLKNMGWWSSLYFVAGAIGSFTSAYLSDRVFHGNRRVMILASFAGLAPFIFLLATLSGASPALLALALCGMGFFANMGWGPLTSVPAEIFSPEVYGRAMGFVNGASYMVTAFSARIFAALVVQTPAGRDYTHGWYFIGSCVVVGVFAAGFIRTRQDRDAGAAEPMVLEIEP